MANQNYPIGIQSFSELITGGYTYVDKTHLIAKLIKEGKYIFLSRPRRFGKSLLLSTINAYFEGRRELFKGLAIDNMDMDWTPTPVLHLDLNSTLYEEPDGLKQILENFLAENEKRYEIEANVGMNVAIRFGNLIRDIHSKTGRKVAILVDEYDKPLLAMEEDAGRYERNQSLLKGFFSNLKSKDESIKFAMLTGVARFTKVSIFSDLNNLNDISMYDQYQEICGWTEEELVSNFKPGIEELARKRGETPDETIGELRKYYDGYLFSDEGKRLYNPFSVLKALYSKTIKPFWFESGTPSFIAKRIKKSGIDPESLNGATRDYTNLLAVDSGPDNIIPLMFQTGYLTVALYDQQRMRYVLRFPNREVEIGFAKNLLPLYAPSIAGDDSPLNLHNFQDDLFEGHPLRFMERLETLFKNLPGEDHRESTYRAVTYLLCLLSGTEAHSETRSYKGRSDLEVLTPGYIYVFEFKYNKSVHAAKTQIIDRDYAGRYAMDKRKIFLIAANFSEDKHTRRLDYEIF